MRKHIFILLSFIFFTFSFSQTDILIVSKQNEKPLYFKKIQFLKYDGDIFLKPDSLFIWKNYQLFPEPEKVIIDFAGTTWLRREVFIVDTIGFEKDFSVNLWNIGDINEIYWDGQLIGKRGDFSKTENVKYKPIYQLVKIPVNLLTVGHHKLHIKFKNLPLEKDVRYSTIELGDDRQFIKRNIDSNYVKIVFTVILFGFALFFLLMFFGFERRISYFLLATFCFANASKSFLSPMWILHSQGVALSSYNDVLCEVFYTLGNHALLAFFILKFKIRELSYPLAVIFFLVPGLIIPYDYKIGQVSFFIASYLMIFYGFYKNYPGKWFSFTAMSVFGIWSLLRYFSFIWQGYFLGVIFFAVVILFEATREIAMQVKQKREANLRSARLENELLKKNIQPHFILNTLTALQEVVEESPKQANKLIQALADEFRLFSKVAGEKLIQINEELEICTAHLKIMEYRKDAKFSIQTINIDGNELLPPGLIHTVIENGLTHGFKSKTNGEFVIEKIVKNDCTVFKISNNGSFNKSEIKKGTGIKYIETRLEESFPGQWEFVSESSEKGWLSEIKICKNNRI